ncbi:hypothetical protein AB0M38_35000 [Streptomyces sp. NPDC051742]
MPTAEIASLHEFTHGFFNAVHGVHLADRATDRLTERLRRLSDV